jgi:hypothetical protein
VNINDRFADRPLHSGSSSIRLIQLPRSVQHSDYIPDLQVLQDFHCPRISLSLSIRFLIDQECKSVFDDFFVVAVNPVRAFI